MTRIVGDQCELPFCCGVDDVGAFEGNTWSVALNEVRSSGTGLFTATFIDSGSNKNAYEVLCREHKLLYQSPVKENNNSGNDLFLCVFEYVAPRRGERLPRL